MSLQYFAFFGQNTPYIFMFFWEFDKRCRSNLNWKPAHLKVGLLNSSREGSTCIRTYSTFTFQLGLPAQNHRYPLVDGVSKLSPPRAVLALPKRCRSNLTRKPAHLDVGLLHNSSWPYWKWNTYSTFTFQHRLTPQNHRYPLVIRTKIGNFGSPQKVPEQFDLEAGTFGGRPATRFKLRPLKMNSILDFHIPTSSYTSKPALPYFVGVQNGPITPKLRSEMAKRSWNKKKRLGIVFRCPFQW